MYTGLINGQIVFCCHPFVVLGNQGVAASFKDLEGALRFLAHRGVGAARLYRHAGLNWDKVEVDPVQVLERYS